MKDDPYKDLWKDWTPYHDPWNGFSRWVSNGCWRYRYLIALVIVIMVLVGITHRSRAAECPQGVPKCKVLVLTPDMENALTGQNMILDTAEWGNRAGLTGAVQFFKKAIADAPAGEVKKPEEPKK